MRTSVTKLCEAIKDRKWRVTMSGQIRSGHAGMCGHCPLVAGALDLAPELFEKEGGRGGDGSYIEASRVIGFTGDEEDFIVAADDTIEEVRRSFRYSSESRSKATRIIRIRKKLFKLLDLSPSRL